MKTLKLFNAVISKKGTEFHVSDQGFIVEPNAMWTKDRIVNYYTREKLNGNDLNKTFHKSWKKIKESSRFELFVDQIIHYLSTYGTNFESEVYIPDEVLEVPDLNLSYKVIRAYTEEEMTTKCLGMLRSGMALKEETVDDLISVLVDELDYTFTGKEGIKNKEAVVKLAENYGIFPENPVEFFRYIIYRTTNTTLLIKNEELITAIKNSSYNPSTAFKKFGLESLAEIFNRFKPLFLAYKTKCPKTVNKISKLSKKYHKPLISNPLNNVTNKLLSKEDMHWLDNATPFALFKAMSACHTRIQGQDSFVYRVRNGKSWAKEVKPKSLVHLSNFSIIVDYIRIKYNFQDKKFFIPKDVQYALPTSEKMFVGNVPTGTKFYGEKLAAGVYWKNAWGARDLDLSGLNIGGKIGWNSSYNQGEGSLMYSGDITNAPNGAVEYLYANRGLNEPTLVQNNVYAGDDECEYKFIIGRGEGINRDYMMNPNNLFAEIKCKSVQKQSILGMFLPENGGQSFVILNFGAGQTRVSGNSEISMLSTKALYQQWKNPLSFKEVIELTGGEIVDTVEEADINLSLDNLERDSFTKIFE